MSESTVDNEVTAERLKELLISGESPELTALNDRWVDMLVREARRRAWCSEFDAVMARYASAWMRLERDGDRYLLYDSEGFNCRGFDSDGYDGSGFDQYGYDRDGCNSDGFDRDGFGRDGFNRYGYDRDGVDREGFDREGTLVDHQRGGYEQRYRFDSNGYDREGFNYQGVIQSYSTRATLAARLTAPAETYRYDRSGYTREQRESDYAETDLSDRNGAVRGCTCDSCADARRM